jgi:hypothetical protein
VSLATVEIFRVSESIVQETEEALRTAGAQGYEAFVLWSGKAAGEAFDVLTAHVPKQTSYKLEDGLCVRVDGSELHRLNIWLYETSEILGIQIHSHPTDAYHSTTDSTYPIVTLLGGLSLVVPDFGRRGLRDSGVAAYRLEPHGWKELRSRNVRRLIKYVG